MPDRSGSPHGVSGAVYEDGGGLYVGVNVGAAPPPAAGACAAVGRTAGVTAARTTASTPASTSHRYFISISLAAEADREGGRIRADYTPGRRWCITEPARCRRIFSTRSNRPRSAAGSAIPP